MKNKYLIEVFGNLYREKRILVTGHTGFKGSWLSTWLTELGARVIGFSLDLPTQPSNFEILNLKKKVIHIQGDVRDLKQMKKVFADYSPEVVFHLAAQAITRRSYDLPQETFFTNLGGTVNILECIRKTDSVKTAVIITSDKCYQNFEWLRGYREDDRLGGDDPYSASKASAEIACHSYIKSFFSKGCPKIATARAGNVIGGGDWAIDRIVPDCVRAFSKGEILQIRNPRATRPWQHVLEPLSGYLWLGANLLKNNKKEIAGESFNFGPPDGVDRTVEELIKDFTKVWGHGNWSISKKENIGKQESTLLKLNCDKALRFLNWHAALSFEETVKMTAQWYKTFYAGRKNMYRFTAQQIEDYIDLAQRRGLVWTK